MTFVPREAPVPFGPDAPNLCSPFGAAGRLAAPSAPSPFAPEPARVRRVHRETATTFTATIEVPGRPGGLAFAPGQFNMLYAFGVGEVAISISGDPARPDRLLHTIREAGSVTRALGSLRAGMALGLRGPFGSPWPVGEARGADVLLLAGGLGMAPLRPALCHILRHRAAYGRVALLYGARGPEDLLYRRELERWSRRADLQVLVTVDRAGPGWRGHVGVVPALLRLADFDPGRAVAFVCGPEVMMRFTARELERRGVPGERVYASLERNMKCAVGLCGRCQLGPSFVCKDGPVLRYDRVGPLLAVREL
ncbi:FAD/NAD(P)-binding protein [Sorangium cellulosum]|uniref:Oxidoreductase n=1 Tax=Sorangium cellulosum So0157-2 TaxID=1254432 RepID=S4Y219_SORCE|nr:FAD/NAD(P)-binding protein [Sorangium cellulosum]AGP39517.1 oxidoreductase [Sorangium cellulosum So0157-2]